MYTAFTADAKRAVSDCWATVQGIHAKQEQNESRFQPEYCKSENAKLSEQQKSVCQSARSKIGQICDKAAQDAATLDECIPLNLDERNAQRVLTLLNGQFTLNVKQLQHLVDEYVGKTDYTLLNAVNTYCAAHGMRLNRATTETRRAGIETIRADALSLVGRMEAANYKNANRERGQLNTLLSAFCADSDYSRELCQRLGQDFSGAVLSPMVELEHPLSFDFKGVRPSA